jgi:hypothetical protein
MLDLRKANRYKFPTFRYTNWKKTAPQASEGCWKQWVSFKRYWGGRIWCLLFKHHQFELDFRLCVFSDMAFGNVTKQDRKAVDDAAKRNTHVEERDSDSSN